MESTSYVPSFRMAVFYLVITGWVFDISLCEIYFIYYMYIVAAQYLTYRYLFHVLYVTYLTYGEPGSIPGKVAMI